MENYLHNRFSFFSSESLTTRKSFYIVFVSFVGALWNKFTYRYSLVVRLSLEE